MIAPTILNRLVARLANALVPPAQALSPWVVGKEVVGWLDERRAALLAAYPAAFVVGEREIRLHPRLADAGSRTNAIDEVVRDLSRRGELTRWRDERYAVTAASGVAVLLLERSAARFFGVRTVAAHVNGTTLRGGASCMWIARRSATKAIDPGQLDNLVGGGVPAGASVSHTVVREAEEEAGIPSSLSRRARHRARIEIRRMQPDGLHHDTIHPHDLELPPSFVPANRDGEVVEFRLVTPEEVALVAGNSEGPDLMTADASLVVADWLLRTGHVPHGSPAAIAIDRMRRAESA